MLYFILLIFFEQVKMRYIKKKLCSLAQGVLKEAEQNYNIQSLKSIKRKTTVNQSPNK